MKDPLLANSGESVIDLVSYGVRLRFIAETSALLEEAVEQTCAVIPGILPVSLAGTPTAVFELFRQPDGTTRAVSDGEEIVTQIIRENFYHVFTTFVRLAIAENSPELLFMHAGAVGWHDKGIILPGDSFVGKSTLVTELVKLGATYYSDDYAVFDRKGQLHTFPRAISMRADDGKFTRFRLKPEDLGGRTGVVPINVACVWMTRYELSASWEPKNLTRGQGVLEMLPYTFGFADRPQFSLPILNSVVSHAMIISSKRGPAEIFAKTFLEFVDKHIH